MSKHSIAVASCSPSIDRNEFFQLVKHSDMNTAEVENAERSVIEVSVLWQTSILRVVHLDGSKCFVVASDGEDREDRMVLDESMLPSNTSELSIVTRSNGACFVMVPGAKGEIEKDGQKLSIEQAVESRIATMRTDGHVEVTLSQGVRCKMSLGSLTFSARAVAEGRRVTGRSRRDPAIIASMLGAFALVGSLVGAGHMSHSQSSSLLSDSNEDRLADIAAMVNRARERTQQAQPQTDTSNSSESTQAVAARSEQARSDRRDAPAAHLHRPMHHRNAAPPLARPQDARQMIGRRGIFAALDSPSAMTAVRSQSVNPWVSLMESDRDRVDAQSNLPDVAIVSYAELGPLSIGVSRNGNDTTVCSETTCGFNTIRNTSNGDALRYAATIGTQLRSRQSRSPVMRPQVPEVAGQYDRELVRRVVLRNMGQITRCHEQGLQQNPELAGRVVVTFSIQPNGSVLTSAVRENSTQLPSVGTCIANAIRTWQFTAPQSLVTVHYPFLLQHAL